MSELLKINVNDHTEKKNGLTYLSWAWAWAEVLKIDPNALWAVQEYGSDHAKVPCMFLPDGSAMVKVSVSIKGAVKACLLPVMDHRNKAIKNPDAFAINTAIMRCLAKAISMHGLGLYIYAGEDLPEGDESEKPGSLESQLKASIDALKNVRVSPLEGAGKHLSDERRSELDDIALHLIDCHKAGNDIDAIRIWYDPDTFAKSDDVQEDRKYIWSRLATESKLRAAIKANKPEEVRA